MKKKYFIFISLVSILISGCQSDAFQLDIDTSTTISSTSLLNSFLQRSLQNNTTKDNFIDGSSAVKIEFPYAIQINNQSFNLIEENDYQNVIAFLENENTLVYQVNFTFPLQVSLVNYETTSIQSLTEFDAVLANASESSEINCINFMYPLELNSFSLSDENSTTRILNNQAQFFNYLQLLQQQDGFFQFSYPVSIIVDGQTTEVNSVDDLESIYNGLATPCFEPNLYIPTITPIDQLDEFLIGETFFVFNLLNDGEDDTDEVDEFRFTYNVDGSISVLNTENQTSSNGTWTIVEDDNQTKLDLTFENLALDELVEDWVVEEFGNNNRIRLTDDQDQLIFENIE